MDSVVTERADWKGLKNLLSITGGSEFQLFVCKGGCAQSIRTCTEAYQQKFRKATKEENQTYVEFVQMKERLFDRWCTSQNVNG